MPKPVGPQALAAAERPFIGAIAEDPADDLTRLVYADWLEEQGDPYGEFIRVQIQLENMGATDPKRPGVEKRQRELEHAVSFAGWESRLALHGFDVRCRRGFVDEITAKLHACALPGPGPSRFTARVMRGVLEPLLSASCRFTALPSKLRISGESGDGNYGSEDEFVLPPDVAGDLLALPCFAKLHTLSMDSSGSILLSEEAFRVIVSHPHLGRLRQLSLHDQKVGDEGCRALAGSARMAQLTSLQLTGNGIGNDGARALAGSASLANLTELDLRSNRIDDDGARALADTEYLLALRRLKLHGNAIGPDGARALKARFGEACLLPRLPGAGQSRPGDWYCIECSASNFASRDICYECRSPRRVFLREGDWVCPGCGGHNFARRQTCHRCKARRKS